MTNQIILEKILGKFNRKRDILVAANCKGQGGGDVEEDGVVILYRFHHFLCDCGHKWVSNKKSGARGTNCGKCRKFLTPYESVCGSTPYQGNLRAYGFFICIQCSRQWTSAWSWKNCGQDCEVCAIRIYPYRQDPLQHRGGSKNNKGHQRELCEMCQRLPSKDCTGGGGIAGQGGQRRPKKKVVPPPPPQAPAPAPIPAKPKIGLLIFPTATENRIIFSKCAANFGGVAAVASTAGQEVGGAKEEAKKKRRVHRHRRGLKRAEKKLQELIKGNKVMEVKAGSTIESILTKMGQLDIKGSTSSDTSKP